MNDALDHEEGIVNVSDKRALVPGYEEWLERLSATYEAVTYCCFHRLKDRAPAERVSAEVVAEMLARPKVFQYFGLPFSGQIGRLTEPRISRARQGEVGSGASWQQLRAALLEVPREEQRAFVLTCIEGCSDAEIAAALGCDEETARRRRESMTELLQGLSRSVLSPEEREHAGG
ncbi:MAG: hypothetical protein CYG60_20840 [Actinobacteria bacterium]|nr:MAG: hypothetical protein CYG60_20840 [Actinomycetota bacterium]